MRKFSGSGSFGGNGRDGRDDGHGNWEPGVLEVGNGLTTSKAVIKQLFSPYFSCGKCIACLRSQPNAVAKKAECFGVHSDGGMKEKIVVDAVYVRQIVGPSLKRWRLLNPWLEPVRYPERKPTAWQMVVAIKIPIYCWAHRLGIMAQALHASCKVIGCRRGGKPFRICKRGLWGLTVPADQAIAYIKNKQEVIWRPLYSTPGQTNFGTGLEYMAHGIVMCWWDYQGDLL